MTSSGSGRARRKIPWPRFALRVTAVWLSAAAGIVIVAALLDGVSITQRGAALAAGALLALLNGLVWPVVVRFGLPLTVLTLGLGPLLLNGAFVLLSVQFVTGVHISSLWLAVVVALVITLVTTTVTALLALDDDDYWYRHTVLRPARGAAPSVTDVPGVIFLQIDGLGHGVLQRALRDGRRVVRRRKVEGEVQLGPERQATAAPGADDATVFASGNLGLVYLTQFTHRLTREEIDEQYPKLLPALVEHPGVGFVLVKSAQGTPLVLGAKGWRDLEDGTVFGADPLEPFGPSAARQVLRTHGFPHCADLMVNSMWDEQTGEVAAFEELVGSHGGLGGEQTHPFVLYPSDLPAPEEAIHGAESLHQVFRGWLAHLGHDRYAAADAGADGGSDKR